MNKLAKQAIDAAAALNGGMVSPHFQPTWLGESMGTLPLDVLEVSLTTPAHIAIE